MTRSLIGLALGLTSLAGCNGGDKKDGDVSTSQASTRFKPVKSFQLTDTDLLGNKDTTTIPASAIHPQTPDSTIKAYFGKSSTTLRYTPLVQLKGEGGSSFLIVKASSGAKKGALIVVDDLAQNVKQVLPLLLPDADPGTVQISSIDNDLTITKSITKKDGSEVVGEGKEVWAFDEKAKAFSLVALDPLDDAATAVRNPIDTFPKTNRFAGDYLSGKKGIVSVRDGRHANQLLVYIHTEDASGDCVGQMKGEFTITSSTTAAFRQGGDPCVLNLSFKGNTVSLAEASGCGNYRELDCPFTGTFTKKKAAAAKPAAAKPRRG